jgi:hypothetical protein
VRTHVVLYIPSADTIYAKLVRKLGWPGVHVDVSVGDIQLCNGIAKLADLKNAKKVGDYKTYEMQMARRFSITFSGK